MLSGQLDEAVYRHDPATGSLTEYQRAAGTAVGFGPRYVHDVRNLSDAPAVSVHAYSPPLTSMNFYDVADGRAAAEVDHRCKPTTRNRASAKRSRQRPRLERGGGIMTAVVRARRSSPSTTCSRTRGDRCIASTADETVAALAAGARLVDIRPAWQRAREGEIAGSLIVERNHLEWRLHPRSSARLPGAVAGQRWIVVCSEGYTSSLGRRRAGFARECRPPT